MSERERFEKWCDNTYGNQAYLHKSPTCGEWGAWQAALDAPGQPAPSAHAVAAEVMSDELLVNAEAAEVDSRGYITAAQNGLWARQGHEFAERYPFRLRRLAEGEQIKAGDWCFDARCPQPVLTVLGWVGCHMTEQHHPHFRIEFVRPVAVENERATRAGASGVAPAPSTQAAACPDCNGYGRVNDGSGARSPYGPKCPNCGGSGRVHAPQPAQAQADARLKVAVDLLREVVGPLEVSAAIIESDDGDAMEALIGNVKRYVEQYDAAISATTKEHL